MLRKTPTILAALIAATALLDRDSARGNHSGDRLCIQWAYCTGTAKIAVEDIGAQIEPCGDQSNLEQEMVQQELANAFSHFGAGAVR
jgi:hypothetical protein